MSQPGATLVDRVAALRGEVLDGAEGEREAPGSEVFDAALRVLSLRERARHRSARAGAPGDAARREGEVDLALHDAIARRLAWRDSELRVLADAREVCRRLLASARRGLEPADQIEVAAAVAEAGSAAARILVTLVLGRVGRERSALVREELAQERLTQALARQRDDVARLEETLAAWRPPASDDTDG